MSDVASASLSIGIIIIESLILLLSWNGVMRFKCNNQWTYIMVITLLTATTFFANVSVSNAYIKLIIYFLLLFVIMRLFYSNPWYVLLFCSAFGIAYLKAIDNTVLYLYSLLLDVTPQTIFRNPYSFVFLALLSKMIEFIGAWLFSRFSKQHRKKEATHWRSWVQALPLPLAACFFLSFALQFSLILPETAPLLLLLAGVFLSLCVLQFSIAQRLDAQRQSEQENQKLHQTLELRKESLQSLTEAYTIQRRLTHEFNNNLAIIASLANTETLQELQQYVKGLQAISQNSTLVVHTGNAVMDAVLNQKYRVATQHNITIDFDMTNLANLPLRNEELAVVISNLLDNAIEACIDYEGARIIRLKIKIHNEQLVLMVTNPTKKEPHRIEGKWITSKSDSLIHGFGLSNVENILDSFKSEYTSKFTNGIFSFVAFIPLQTPISGNNTPF